MEQPKPKIAALPFDPVAAQIEAPFIPERVLDAIHAAYFDGGAPEIEYFDATVAFDAVFNSLDYCSPGQFPECLGIEVEEGESSFVPEQALHAVTTATLSGKLPVIKYFDATAAFSALFDSSNHE